MEDVIKLPVTEDRAPAKKRLRPPKFDPEDEERKRQKNVQRLAVLGEKDSSVKQLEELVFGAEEELVERLVEVTSHQTPFKDLLIMCSMHRKLLIRCGYLSVICQQASV